MMKRTTFRNTPVLLMTVEEAKQIRGDRPLRVVIPGFPFVYGIEYATSDWAKQQKRNGRYNVNRYAFLLAPQEIPHSLDMIGMIHLDRTEKEALFQALEGQCHSVK